MTQNITPMLAYLARSYPLGVRHQRPQHAAAAATATTTPPCLLPSLLLVLRLLRLT